MFHCKTIKLLSICLLYSLLCVVNPCFGQSGNQLIWFAPHDSALRPWGISGSTDYADLFTGAAPWSRSSSRVSIFKVYASIINTSLPNAITDAQIRQAFVDLERRGISLAVEWGPLTPEAGARQCGMGVEGFDGVNALVIANRIKDLGGNLRYIAMDEPFHYATSVCKWTPQQIAANAAISIAEMKRIFPNVLIGDIEPIPGDPQVWPKYGEWIDAIEAAMGQPLTFFHADIDWRRSDYPQAFETIRQTVATKRIPLGVIYNGTDSDTTDLGWVSNAQKHYESVEVQLGLIPEHAIFQSWNRNPRHLLPESDPTTFTHLINTYFRTRTSLTASYESQQISGTLTDGVDKPIAGSTIKVSAQPTTGPGIVSNYTMTGVVPPSMTQALVQICVNKCGTVGTNDISVYSFSYSDAGYQQPLNVSSELTNWGLPIDGIRGNGAPSVSMISDSDGQALSISATPSESIPLNSSPFPVAPGSTYTLSIRARVSPSSIGSGSFALIFLAGSESSREQIPFVPANISFGTVQTKSDGSYNLAFIPPSVGTFEVQTSLVGDDEKWPALAKVSATLIPSFTLNLGWNLLGNGGNTSATAASLFGDSSKVVSIWKWATSGTFPGTTYPTWAFYSPGEPDGGAAYAKSLGYEPLVSIKSGEGFWVNSRSDFNVNMTTSNLLSANVFKAGKSNSLSSGWNLVATGDNLTPSEFSKVIGSTTGSANATPANPTSLWAWDNKLGKWRFYSPSLEAQGASVLNDYIRRTGYLDFTSADQTLGPNVGFWVNMP